MPIDAVFLESLCEELQEKLLACRVDKVQQPERDTILLSMRGASGGGKLLLTASPNHPRIQLTNLSFENPAQPPMFCMLLRKHLTGGRLVSISQPPLERPEAPGRAARRIGGGKFSACCRLPFVSIQNV